MVVSIHLEDEEKFQVLLVALALFLFALLVSICLAFACCPLNKWLAKRQARQAKRRRQPSPPAPLSNQWHRNIIQHHRRYYANKSAPASNGVQRYAGPPPAYEVALKANRLQSLTGNCQLATLHEQAAAAVAASCNQDKSSPDWLRTALTNTATYSQDDEPQLDLGDYFHQPREFQVNPDDQHVLIPMGMGQHPTQSAVDCQNSQHHQTQPERPIMLRLWVKLIEPGELVEQARAQTQSAKLKRQQEAEQQQQQQQQQQQRNQSALRRMSMTRQLSIPQLFGSLMTTLASNKSSAAICGTLGGKQAALEPLGATGSAGLKEAREEGPDDDGAREQHQHHQLSSLSSDTSSSANYSSFSTNDLEQYKGDTSPEIQATDRTATGANVSATANGLDCDKEMGTSSKEAGQHELVFDQRRRHSIPPIASSITSRVLHMNVASFSYVKDESLISTKKHNQLNFHHFYAPLKTAEKADSNKNSSKKSKTSDSGGKGKMCQLLVSICDVENLLSSSGVRSKACMRLAENSSIYVKCEILAPKSANLCMTATRLLRNPLKVLTHQQSSSASMGSSQHATVHFASTLPATAIEPTPTIQLTGGNSPSALHEPGGGGGGPDCGQRFEVASGEHSDQSACAEQGAGGQKPAAVHNNSSNSSGGNNCFGVNWRHEPSADGKSIVVFNSIPKQVAQQEQLAYALMGDQCCPVSQTRQGEGQLAAGRCAPVDLVQFDSVFVSPILAKSTLEEGHIRLRVYSQCKYVNETCLAELKLPLKQLMRVQSRDNLGDIMAAQAGAINRQQQRQADLILDNLLANLVTASTGSPLSALIEQISAEAHEEENELKRNEQHTSSFRLSSWLPTASSSDNCSPAGALAASGHTTATASGSGGAGLPRASSSLGAALNYLDLTQQGSGALVGSKRSLACDERSAIGGEDGDERTYNWKMECDRLIERNYCRSLMVSHWLNYLVAPSYECQPVEEPRGKLVLGLTYLPTSNRVIFNAHRATVEFDACHPADKQLIKRLRLHSDTSYLLRFMMVANDRVLKRKQTACSRKPEWDSQGAVTFDLVSVSVERPSFIVALVMRNSRSIAHATGSLQSLANYCQPHPHQEQQQQQRISRDAAGQDSSGSAAVRSDSELLRHNVHGAGGAGDLYRQGAELGGRQRQAGGGKRDLVVGHLVLADEIWHELRAQPRRQIIRQFKLL